MKRHGYLYPKLCNTDNLRLAHQNARKGKTHYRDVKKVDGNPELYLRRIQKMLLTKKYVVGRYTIFKKRAECGKVREIYRLSYFPHRIIHHAILQIVEPIWLPTYIADSYCCIKGRGIHRAMQKIQRLMRREKPEYCLKLDVKKFYPSCKNHITKQIIRRKIKDPDMLWLLDTIIDSCEGLPIGNYMSQHLANLFLTPFDWYCKQVLGIKHYFRYCDDIVIFNDSKPELHMWLNAIQAYMRDECSLELKDNYQIFPTNTRGVDFLGYRFFHNYTLLRKRTSKRVLRRARRIKKKQHASTADLRSMMSYKGWMAPANTHNLQAVVYDPDVRRAIAKTARANNIKNPLRRRKRARNQ